MEKKTRNSFKIITTTFLMATFETKNVHITLLLGHWLQKSLKRIELWILKIKCNFIAPALIQQFFIALIFPCLDHYSAARPVPIVMRPIVVLVTLSHISRSTCLRPTTKQNLKFKACAWNGLLWIKNAKCGLLMLWGKISLSENRIFFF